MCNAEAASVEAVADEWSGRAAFVGVAWSGDRAHYEEFIARHGLTFPQIDDTAGDIFARFDLVRQPAAVVVDTDGAVRTLKGRADGAEIEALIAGTGD